ncbi:LPS export ABC transporter periplasmic protein LptC [Desulfovibrio gilichinskyi]|uniref:LPS export ABC transporter protein LptC n=1 Tax=Desulfovibrio gilichinskyi TaxID=1519643 RepID=A0A1X7F0F3_9BACT|nr:LPS export ABC transporter periplasmic protein LptC [Desulfovibrio gilichinskyi]SMF43281.1 LPS export ABC transporter protein LptC [Desulfovibrio gilichinskyi]
MGRISSVCVLLAVLFTGIVTGTLLGSKFAPRPPMAGGPIDPPPLGDGSNSDVSAEGIELVQGTGGDIEWVLRAGNADYDQENGIVKADKPKVTYYLGRDRKKVYVKALYGEVSQQGKGLKLWDHVEGHYEDMRLQSDKLDFNPKENLIFLEGNVKVQSPSIYISSQKVKVDLKTREIMIEDGVEALIAPDTVAMP